MSWFGIDGVKDGECRRENARAAAATWSDSSEAGSEQGIERQMIAGGRRVAYGRDVSHARVDPDAAAVVKVTAQHFTDSGLSQASVALGQAQPPAAERSRLR
jgi:hypothetical protein